MIDVLAFPPTPAALAAMRARALVHAERIERQARVARFVAVGLFLGWIADIAAAFAPAPASQVAAFAVASIVLALLVLVARALAQRLPVRAARLRATARTDYATVDLAAGRALLARAPDDSVVAQYLRMVGRQRRPLLAIELAALNDWLGMAPGER
jgi:hypothetical protein